LRRIRLDVAAPNQRAIRCYEKAGFRIVEEFWRDDPDVPRYDMIKLERASIHMKSHVRFDRAIPQVRFYWMEAAARGFRKG
jgi:RimJ/RimL family protein N-acetyltransferase